MLDQQDLEFAKTVMPAFIDSAKMFSQLSAGALVLSIGFQEKVLGRVGRKFVTHALVVSWFFFLIAIGSGAVYQWSAVHFMHYYLSGLSFDEFYGSAWYVFFMQPGIWYGIMMVAFFSGAALLVAGSARQLYGKREA
jgi:TRAP-type C4-dicarboxylate transport system permease small subunit